MKFKSFLALVVVVVILVIRVYYLPRKQPATNILPTPTTSVLGGSSESACKARQANPSDSQAYLPDPNCTPGEVNSAVSQDNIGSTICHAGFTKTIRPPVPYTDDLKKRQIAEYGYTDTNPSNYEEDHLISLELGGNPSDPKNLWPEPHPSMNEKDLVENYLNKEVCQGRMTLVQAQGEIAGNWYEVYKTIGR